MKPQFNDVSVDLETLGTGPNAPIVSIGAVAFDRNTGKLGSEFYQVVQLQSVVKNPAFTMDAGTLAWWMHQSDKARHIFTDEAQKPAHALPTVLDLFAAWVRNLGPVGMWGNGKSFDIGLLDYAYRWGCVGLTAPWHYSKAYDQRTIIDAVQHLDPHFQPWPATFKGTEHNALDDARNQAVIIGNCFRRLRELSGAKPNKPVEQDDGEL